MTGSVKPWELCYEKGNSLTATAACLSGRQAHATTHAARHNRANE